MAHPLLHPITTVPEHLQGSVERFGFFDRQKRIRGDACPDCGTAIDGIGMNGA